jgi:hypothetical protein
MTEIQNPKQLAFELICDLDIVIWNLFVICDLLFIFSDFFGSQIGGGSILGHVDSKST